MHVFKWQNKYLFHVVRVCLNAPFFKGKNIPVISDWYGEKNTECAFVRSNNTQCGVFKGTTQYGVAMVSRLLKIIGLFCERAL